MTQRHVNRGPPAWLAYQDVPEKKSLPAQAAQRTERHLPTQPAGVCLLAIPFARATRVNPKVTCQPCRLGSLESWGQKMGGWGPDQQGMFKDVSQGSMEVALAHLFHGLPCEAEVRRRNTQPLTLSTNSGTVICHHSFTFPTVCNILHRS